MEKNITFCGNILVDSVKTITSWPERGMPVSITCVRRSVGGSVCNSGVCRAAERKTSVVPSQKDTLALEECFAKAA